MGVIDFSINERLLQLLVEQLGTEVFFETGTFKGASIELARRFVPRCMSVEMAPALHEAAAAKFAGDQSIELFLGDSPEIIRQCRERLAEQPVLYWLDAHWCSDKASAGAESQSPLIGELDAMGQLNDNTVVAIDDARFYVCTPPPPHRYADWPTFDEVVRALMQLSSAHRIMIVNDVILFYPEKIHTEMAAYAHEHGVNWRHIARDARKYQRVRKILNAWRPSTWS